MTEIDPEKCIQCGLCHIACEDTAHQAIAAGREEGKRVYSVIDEECVGCNLCMHVCPAEGCITMKRVDDGQDYQNWTQHSKKQIGRASSRDKGGKYVRKTGVS